VISQERVLLIKRAAEPLKGRWSIPGGKLELGETLHEGVRREVLEECGLDIRVLDTVEIFERIIRDETCRVAYHYVLVDYLCESAGGDLQAGDDAEEAHWARRQDLQEYNLTEGTLPVIEKAFALRDRLSAAPFYTS
jgi:mutator protein MutT